MAFFLICMSKLIWRCVLLSNYFTFFNSSSLWEKSTVSLWAAPDSTCIVMTITLCPPLLCMTASNASFTSERCKNVWNTRKYMKDVYLPTNIFWTKLMMWNEYYKCNCKIVSLFFLYQFTKQIKVLLYSCKYAPCAIRKITL